MRQIQPREEEQPESLPITWVSAGEIAYLVERWCGQRRLKQVLATLEAAALESVPAERELTLAAAHFKATHPVACTDAYSAALAVMTEATLVKEGPEFQKIEDIIHIQ